MNVSVSIYQRKVGPQLFWTTIGLGEYTVRAHGRSPSKLRKTIIGSLKGACRDTGAAAVAKMLMRGGTRLKRVRLDLTLRGSGRRREGGLYPLILEPREVDENRKVTVAYHPARQDEWFVVPEDVPLDLAAKRYFESAWRDLSAPETERLRLEGRDSLNALSFVVRRPSLLRTLRSERSIWDDLHYDPNREKKKKTGNKSGRQIPLLKRLGTNLTERVVDGTLDVGMPRDPQRLVLSQLLVGATKRSTLLIGKSGVGKSTLRNRLIADMLDADDYPTHRNLDLVHHVWQLSAKRLIAGMSYLGEWEQRVIDVLESARGQKVILCFDDIHTFGRVGRTRGSDRCFADLFRGPVARGEVILIGEMTEAQFSALERDVPAFAGAFATLAVPPTDRVETIRVILHAIREQKISVDRDVVQALVELVPTLFPDVAMPGIAVELLRRCGPHLTGAPYVAGDGRVHRDVDQVIAVMSERTGLEEHYITPHEAESRETLERWLAMRVMGQPEAVRAATDLSLRVRAGLTDPTRPYATYLFTGPTGTGKTEMCKAIDQELYDGGSLLRFDMGEYSGPDAVARLIGDRFEPNGALTSAVRERPFSVVLFDEVEKAHPSFAYLLLQLLDDGRLTDASGETTDFSRTVIIMTSNLGARAKARVGFGEAFDAQTIKSDVSKAVKEFFPPELFNRIDRVVPFAPLTPELARKIAEKELAQLLARRGLSERNVFVFAHEGAVARMAKEAFDVRDGARSVKRYLERQVGGRLAEEMAKGGTAEMRIYRIYDQGGEYQLDVQELTEAEPINAEYALDGLLHASAETLAKNLPAALRRIDAVDDLHTDALRAKRAAHVEAYKGDLSRADIAHAIDTFLEEFTEFRERLENAVHHAHREDLVAMELKVDGSAPAPPLRGWRRTESAPVVTMNRRAVRGDNPISDRGRLLHALAKVHMIERQVTLVEDPEQHSVFIEIMIIGQARTKAGGTFAFHLAEFYDGHHGETERVATATGDSVEGAIGRHVRHVVIEKSGPGLLDYYQGETGCHIWDSVSLGSQVARVRVFPTDGRSPKQVIMDHRAKKREFDAALETDTGLPFEDPDRLLPAVRRTRFDPPRGNKSAPIMIEDYTLAYLDERHANTVTDMYAELLLLRASRIVELNARSSEGADS